MYFLILLKRLIRSLLHQFLIMSLINLILQNNLLASSMVAADEKQQSRYLEWLSTRAPRYLRLPSPDAHRRRRIAIRRPASHRCMEIGKKKGGHHQALPFDRVEFVTPNQPACASRDGSGGILLQQKAVLRVY